MTPILRRSLSSTVSVWGLALLTASGCRAPAGDLEPEKESDRNFVTGGDRSAAALSRS